MITQVEKLIIKGAILLSVLFLFYYGKAHYELYTKSYQKDTIGNEVYESLNKSKRKAKGVKKLLLGDSIGKQLYDSKDWNDTIYSLTCNQAISLAGQYIFLKNFVDNNTLEPDFEVILLCIPPAFRNNLDQIFTYHYFVKPFYTAENRPSLTDLVHEQVGKVPYSAFAQFPMVKVSDWAPDVDFVSNRDTVMRNPFISDISMEYLQKIKELAAEKGFRFQVRPTFMKETYRDADFRRMKAQIRDNGLGDIFGNYFGKIQYLKEELFMDHAHLKNRNSVKKNWLDL